QIIQVIKDNPGISKTQVREMDSIHGKNRVIGDIVDTLVDSGDVIKEGAGLTWDEAEAEEVTQI
ncbi:MAG: hypothetical protein GWN39_00210, partial [Thermoplasmata archaeon]|nr:hypothetical protein [Thermoplasmata archaeon]NIT75354.1 hypothetical protein [Thermoplasmata archaeon]NIU47534.1 hypothetical protein [Thermoplasmata archaeon]NIV77190.1 hypothetical protein [Thermoplasmata archaeon]NIY01725.1 hypothetical protein [Thermoplasmata archaeon]